VKLLYRIDPKLNMNRFYKLDVQRDLFGQWCCIREWGRVGRAGRIRVVSYSTPKEAFSYLSDVLGQKEARGYICK
jgi:predicted DNA-binding WGR domain protein